MKTILCVDDQEAGLEIRRLLLEAQGHRVITAVTGAEALETVHRKAVDLVVLDYRLTDISGEEVAKRLKRDHPNVPILLLSGYPQVPESAKAVVDAFIVKGDPTEAFLRTIDTLLNRRAGWPHRDAAATLESSQALLKRSRELLKQSQSLANQRKSRS